MNDKIFYTEDGFAIKTLFVKSLAKDLNGDHLFDYFSTFGSLQSVRIHVHATTSFGFVKFDDVEAAAKVLKMNHHAIDGRDITVEIADKSHQDEPTTNDELRIESTNATGTKFMDLNDDCLREILTRVTNMDLCSLLEWTESNKSIRLKEMINDIFRRKYKSCTELNAAATTVDEVERLLEKFGSQISFLKTDGRLNATPKLKSIIQWCSGTLERLRLSNYKIGKDETEGLKKLCRNLTLLDIDNCHFEINATDLFACCKSLDSLTVVNHVPDKESIFQHTYPQLTILICRNLGGSINYNLENFISRHKKLKWVQLLSSEDHSALLPILADNCTDLNELAISTNGDENPFQYETFVKSISALNKLKEIMISYDRNAVKFIQELNHLPSLSELRLVRVRCVPGLVGALLQLKMLTILDIRYCEDFTNFDPLAELSRLEELRITSNEVASLDLIYMVSRLTKLKEFVLNLKDFTIDEKMHLEIVDARSKSGSAKRTLEILCNGPTTHFRF